jgi:hypothetical protein
MGFYAPARRSHQLRAHAKDQAIIDSLVEPSLDEEEAFDSLEAGPDFGSPLQPARPVRASLVSCNPLSTAIRAITSPDPAGVIQRANTRAIAMLDSVITRLRDARRAIIAGATPSLPASSDAARAFRNRFGLDVNDRGIWTGRGIRGVLAIIRRLRGAQQILAVGWMAHTCLGTPHPPESRSAAAERHAPSRAAPAKSRSPAEEIPGSCCAGPGGISALRTKPRPCFMKPFISISRSSTTAGASPTPTATNSLCWI